MPTSEPRRFDMLTAIDNLITFAEVRARALEMGEGDKSHAFEHLASRLLGMLTDEEPSREHIDALLERRPKEAV